MTKKLPLPTSVDLPAVEEQVLNFWRETGAFEHSVNQRPADKTYVFYDGPPFATGMPHYGHLLGSTSKDVIPRYWTMKGYRVERVWGWDCHGLPIENMIEKQLDIKGGKQGIEELGIATFNAACRSEVLRLDKEWERIINRLGRWVDFANNYKTMDTSFMESVWWGFSELYKKGLVYQGRKVVLYCPRCATPLSNFEIAMDNSYEEVSDHSVYIKFALADEPDTYFLAWTTTPWTLPGNVALAVSPDAVYLKVAVEHSEDGKREQYWLAKDRVDAVLKDLHYTIVDQKKGSELVGIHYRPLFSYVESNQPNAWSILQAEFVSLEDGTGIVHTAAIFGEDDYALALQTDLPLVPTLDDNGRFLPFVTLVAGMFYKKAEQPIIDDLAERNLLFRSEQITHSYPFCYRCGTPLYYNAIPAWFIDIQKLKPELLKHNEAISWFPKHLKHGRFGKGLETAPDWNISRSRYWGTPMPIWEAPAAPGADPQRRVISSIDELKQWAVDPSLVEGLQDLHREHLDHIEVWIDENKTISGKRIPEVFDCWVESGSMPFAAKHYPFENQKAFKDSYPGQFISEYIAQTRAWFYTLHVMSVGIFGKHAADTILTTGTVLAADGSKMSKSKKNYPDPMRVINESGADSLRLYLMSSPVMRSENLHFNEKEVADIRKRVFLIWWNCISFYKLVSTHPDVDLTVAPKPETLLDRWMLSKLNSLIKSVTAAMDAYDVVTASRELMAFVNELSTWYLRRSRDQLRRGDAQSMLSQHIFGHALYRLAQLFAPITPFFSEFVHHVLVDAQSSIHHTDWPTADESLIDSNLENDMYIVRQASERAHAERSQAGIKIRQPLTTLHLVSPKFHNPESSKVLLEEINVKQLDWKQGDEIEVSLDTTITPELKEEGEARELIRSIQKLRKEAGLSFDQHVRVESASVPKAWRREIESKTNTTLIPGETLRIVSDDV